jgi:hypothetical protein
MLSDHTLAMSASSSDAARSNGLWYHFMEKGKIARGDAGRRHPSPAQSIALKFGLGAVHCVDMSASSETIGALGAALAKAQGENPVNG